MQVVHHTDTNVGSFDWELPSVIANAISALPPVLQTEIREELTEHIKARLHLLIGTLLLGSKTQVALGMLTIREKETAEIMLSFVQILKDEDKTF
jgi:ABC-type proline/glycine betaine transport system permease subunit